MQLNKLDYIVDKINSHSNLKNRMYVNRKRALTLRIFIILSGSIITVILGIPNFGDAKIIALILSAFITVLSSLDSLNNYHTKSLQQAEIVRLLETLLFEIEFYKINRISEENDDREKVDSFFERYLDIYNNFFKSRRDTLHKSFEIESTK